jgi:hypothetical protein
MTLQKAKMLEKIQDFYFCKLCVHCPFFAIYFLKKILLAVMLSYTQKSTVLFEKFPTSPACPSDNSLLPVGPNVTGLSTRGSIDVRGTRQSPLPCSAQVVCAPLARGITLAMHWARNSLSIPELRGASKTCSMHKTIFWLKIVKGCQTSWRIYE